MPKPRPDAAEYQRYQQQLRAPKPVRRLSRDEIAALEHKRNLDRYLRRGVKKPPQ